MIESHGTFSNPEICFADRRRNVIPGGDVRLESMASADAEVIADHRVAERSEKWQVPARGGSTVETASSGGEFASGPAFGLARTRIRVETRHLAFLDALAARVRIQNGGRLSRAELLALLVRVLLSADLEPESVRSETALAELLRERVSGRPASSDEGIR
jgi:hypothetical protein